MNPGILEMIIGLAMTIKNCVIVIDDFEGYLSSTKNPEHIIFYVRIAGIGRLA